MQRLHIVCIYIFHILCVNIFQLFGVTLVSNFTGYALAFSSPRRHCLSRGILAKTVAVSFVNHDERFRNGKMKLGIKDHFQSTVTTIVYPPRSGPKHVLSPPLTVNVNLCRSSRPQHMGHIGSLGWIHVLRCFDAQCKGHLCTTMPISQKKNASEVNLTVERRHVFL